MPYSREDIFREVTNTYSPLGLDKSKVSVTVSESWTNPRKVDKVNRPKSLHLLRCPVLPRVLLGLMVALLQC